MYKLLFHILFLIISCSVIAQESLIAYYPFDGNANDESGNGYHATVNGATLSIDRFGNENSCYYFDGDNCITVDENTAFNSDETEFTFSFWMKPDISHAKSWQTLIAFGDYSYGGYKVFYTKTHPSINTCFYNYGGNEGSVGKNELYEAIWYLCTFTYKNGTLKQYLNGVCQDQANLTSYPSKRGEGLLIGDGFEGYIDDIRIYNTALSDMEIAKLSGFPGAIRATKHNAYSLADFELGILQPIKYSAYWDVWGNHAKAYTDVVENPVKSGSNTSEYVAVSVTFPSDAKGSDCQKSEYVLTSERGLADEHHHIMKWKLLFTDSTILQLDSITWDWMYFNQIHTGCGKYPHGNQPPEQSIAYGGGIFNDLVKHNSNDPSLYRFRYRAMPDSAMVPFHINIGEWMSFTYEIFWTHSDKGYWRVWKDGELLGFADNVKTLPDCCGEGSNFLHFKTGLYNKWSDPEIRSLSLFFDDIELYIGDDINVDEVCPECSTSYGSEKKYNNE